jgi:hypothetical protein
MALQPVAKGFKPKRTLYRLDFTGTDLEGLEVTARGSSMAELLEVLEGADGIESLKELDEKQDAGKVAAAMREMVAPFARKLHGWNLLDDDDQPVPASLDGLLTQELDFVVAVITAYGQAMTAAPPPLPASSASGGISAEAGIPEAMAELSQSLPSSQPQRLLSGSATAGTACRRSCSRRTRG